ncbi:MAG: deoxyribose-phosphate aldolase [Tepidisphaeraceae bacterium]|jgi:deoxyribose-phosphate aldolase
MCTDGKSLDLDARSGEELAAMCQAIDDAQQKIEALGLTDHTDNRNRAAERYDLRTISLATLAGLIEHTRLSADDEEPPPRSDIAKLCAQAQQYGFYGACVNRPHVQYARSQLASTRCKVVTVIDFPRGDAPTEVKIRQVHESQEADELDMVMAVLALKRGWYREVYQDIRGVVEAAGGRAVKVILETGKLTPQEIVMACLLSKQAGARFVKTSTGKGPRGASLQDIHIMSQCVGAYLGIKAAGGISTYSFARDLVLAGATRIGSSKSVDWVK